MRVQRHIALPRMLPLSRLVRRPLKRSRPLRPLTLIYSAHPTGILPSIFEALEIKPNLITKRLCRDQMPFPSIIQLMKHLQISMHPKLHRLLLLRSIRQVVMQMTPLISEVLELGSFLTQLDDHIKTVIDGLDRRSDAAPRSTSRHHSLSTSSHHPSQGLNSEQPAKKRAHSASNDTCENFRSKRGPCVQSCARSSSHVQDGPDVEPLPTIPAREIETDIDSNANVRSSTRIDQIGFVSRLHFSFTHVLTSPFYSWKLRSLFVTDCRSSDGYVLVHSQRSFRASCSTLLIRPPFPTAASPLQQSSSP